jgi:hypothetical protein
VNIAEAKRLINEGTATILRLQEELAAKSREIAELKERVEDERAAGRRMAERALDTTPRGREWLAEYRELKVFRERAEKALNAVKLLMENSHGVAGLHLNGDIAPWDELRTDGKFEEWLQDFDAAIREMKEG